MKAQFQQILKPFLRFNKRLGATWEGRLAIFLGLCGVCAGVATYGALNALPPFGNDPDLIIWLLNLDFIILLCLVLLVARRVVTLFTLWRRGIPGARLHIRLVLLLSVIALAPAIVMTFFSLYFFHYGVQAWFSDRVKTAVTESQEVAQAYLREHHNAIRADILAMANDLDRSADLYKKNRLEFERFLTTQSRLRNLPETFLFNNKGAILVKVPMNREESESTREINIPDLALQKANSYEVVILTDIEDDKVRALLRLRQIPDAFLFVGRAVDQNVLGHIAATREATQKYDEIAARYDDVRVTVTMIYGVVALMMLFASIWFGLNFARRIATPISNLISVSTRVREGDFTAKALEESGLEEFDYLARSFNKMTAQVLDGQKELMDANRKLDDRSRFTETVLAGVSSGILSIDDEGKITLVNQAALKILSFPHHEIINKNIDEIFPELKIFATQAFANPMKTQQTELEYNTTDGARRTLLLRLSVELVGEQSHGLIVTFDDITNLQSAQRKAAWSDVARRIAHEIKNPLTPIQLSAERLKRKYQYAIPESEQLLFNQLIDTITRHVDDIGTMVTEFSNFARMPEPKMALVDLGALAQSILSLEKNAAPHIEFTLCADEKIETQCDAGQMRQVLTNLIRNAENSLTEKPHEKAAINIDIRQNRKIGQILITVSDTGQGFPADIDPHKLTEPYFTLREQGTGLGLAIVKKIMEDHGGRVIFDTPADFRPLSAKNLENNEGIQNWRGAKIYLTLPIIS